MKYTYADAAWLEPHICILSNPFKISEKTNMRKLMKMCKFVKIHNNRNKKFHI